MNSYSNTGDALQNIEESTIDSLQHQTSFTAEEEEKIRIIRNLSDPTKLKIYIVLHNIEEITVSNLAKVLEVSPSAASHALSDLKNLGLVKSQKCGQLNCYSLADKKNSKNIFSFLNKYL